MAKNLLWLMVIIGFLSSILFYFEGEDVGVFTKILTWSGLGVLAICESIEKSKG